MSDSLHPTRKRFRWSRIDPALPPGIHQPKHDGDVGWDLEAMEEATISPHETADVPINCRVELPAGFWAEIKPRSSIAKRGLQLDGGIIDNGYRGPLFVICRNTLLPGPEYTPQFAKMFAGFLPNRDGSITIQAGERVGQLIFHRLNEVWDEEVESIDIAGSSRGEAAFGSTGR